AVVEESSEPQALPTSFIEHLRKQFAGHLGPELSQHRQGGIPARAAGLQIDKHSILLGRHDMRITWSITASSSTSRSQCASSRPLTTTMVEAGRMSPNILPCTVDAACWWDRSVMN